MVRCLSLPEVPLQPDAAAAGVGTGAVQKHSPLTTILFMCATNVLALHPVSTVGRISGPEDGP
jgi:hypothetical protein